MSVLATQEDVAVATAAAMALATGAAASAASAAAAVEAMSDLLPEFHASEYGMSMVATAAANKVALDNAVAAASAAGGGRVVLPQGWFACNNLDAPDYNNVQIEGQGEYGGTALSCAEATGDFITFSMWGHLALKNVYLTAHVRRTDGFAIKLSGNCFKPRIENVRIDYHYNTIDISGATAPEIINPMIRYVLGYYGIRCYGAPGSPVTRPVINNINADSPYPGLTLGNNAPIEDYAPSTPYELDDIVKVNGKAWQCSQAGTTGAASAPNEIPGVAAADAFTAEVTDGGCKWKFVRREGLIWILVDSYTYSTIINEGALLDGEYGLVMADTANTGTSHPIWVYCWDLEIDHTLLDCVLLLGGEGFTCDIGWWGSSRRGNGVTFGPAFKGEIDLGGVRIAGNWLNGIAHLAGSVDVRVRGCRIGHNSMIGPGICHGVSFGVGASDYSYVDNTVGPLAVAEWLDVPNHQGFAFVVPEGASNDAIITLNRVRGNLNGTVFDAGTGTDRLVENNIGQAA